MFFVGKKMPGFSIPEVALSVFVLSVGIMSIIALMSSSLRYSLQTNDVIIATDLAQEGIELVRNVRDNDFASGGIGFSSPLFRAGRPYCRIDWDESTRGCRNATWSPNSVRYDLQYTNGM